MTTITMINPFSKAPVRREAADLIGNFDGYINLIDNDTIETINNKVDSDDKAEWLATWAAHVGPEAAGLIILGS
jgi:hypothetical protein